jgi:hypothetical protein
MRRLSASSSLVAIVAAWLFAACTTTTSASRPRTEQELVKMNRLLQGREVELRIERTDRNAADVVNGTDVSFQATEVSWTDPKGARRAVPAELLHRLKYLSPESSRARGFWEGGGLGLLIAGAGAALIAGLATSDDPPCGTEQYFCFRGTRAEKALVGGIVFGLLGFGVGGAIGAAVGHHDELDFTANQ